MNLLELAERVEKAERSNEFLDAEIDLIVQPDWGGDAPLYTHSLDAAMQLVPEDTDDTAWFWTVGHDGDGPDPSEFKARLLGARAFSAQIETVSTGATPALALTAAALRARAAMEDAR